MSSLKGRGKEMWESLEMCPLRGKMKIKQSLTKEAVMVQAEEQHITKC